MYKRSPNSSTCPINVCSSHVQYGTIVVISEFHNNGRNERCYSLCSMRQELPDQHYTPHLLILICFQQYEICSAGYRFPCFIAPIPVRRSVLGSIYACFPKPYIQAFHGPARCVVDDYGYIRPLVQLIWYPRIWIEGVGVVLHQSCLIGNDTVQEVLQNSDPAAEYL